MKHTRNVTLKTMNKGGEVQFRKYRLDGYDNDTAYESYGCHCYGHICITRLRDCPIVSHARSLQDRYDAALARSIF